MQWKSCEIHTKLFNVIMQKHTQSVTKKYVSFMTVKLSNNFEKFIATYYS